MATQLRWVHHYRNGASGEVLMSEPGQFVPILTPANWPARQQVLPVAPSLDQAVEALDAVAGEFSHPAYWKYK